MLERDGSGAASRPGSAGPDAITAEIIRHSLVSIPNQIDVNITRTAYSPLVYEFKDYAVGLVDPEGRLISQAKGGIPIFVANALGVAVQDGLRVYGREGIRPGDVIISNHAATLGQHLSNVVMYTPVFVGSRNEDLVGFMAVLVHWVDIGGIVVGSSAPAGTTDIFQEGFQFRTVKLWSEGKRVDDIYRIIEVNTRFPHMLLGDIESQLGGCLRGRDMLAELVGKYGLEVVRHSIELMWDQSEAAARTAIRNLPDGVYEKESFLDSDGLDLDRRVPVKVVITIAGDEMTVDFSEVADQVRGSINSGRYGGAETAARIAFKYLIAPDEPNNDGSFRPLKVVIPDGKFLSAGGTAAMAMYSVPLPTVIDTIVGAMVKAAPERLAAGHHSNFGVLCFAGRNAATGELFFNLGSSHGGWGASRGHDGPGPYKTMAHGDTLDVPGEVQEALYPLQVELQAARVDSGGAGEWRGGWGVERIVVATAPCTAQLNFERTGCPPWGVLGGHEALPAEAFIERDGAPPRRVLKTGNIPLEAGDRVHIFTGGGGGYGNPLARDPVRVGEDVRLGYVSVEAARDIYKVAVSEQGHVDDERTRTLRRPPP